MVTLEGKWKVRRDSGWLPPFGISKRISEGRGVTCVLGIPVAPFRVQGTSLVYRLLPIRDELTAEPDGTFSGRAYLFGAEFCRFRLIARRD